jgi:hypothetical protein
MTVNFFNLPYLLYEGDLPWKATPDWLTTLEMQVGYTFEKNGKDYRHWPVCIYNCPIGYDYDS